MTMRKKKDYDNFSNVENAHDKLIPEEFPEGSFGSPINKDEAVEGKSTPWEEGQRRDSAFVYPDREQHEKVPRRIPGSHIIHDEKDEEQ
ncbi:hypothetical protein GCM10007111_25770 [Virgibacillus kapii]|uniref:Cytosolic protein n=1 Tax=Virgibacillus kapii TaxID=1638645 RepID=A0ABQ2DMV2_9BACI|nr:hypothetical protein M948_01825 [Virgibacillus sp. CM-4]GGJ62506.1 hypothetical protein GCM10007111_25770 [Virgibacillus kapii]